MPGCSGLWGLRDGIAALEFAIVAPIMITACIGLYDLTEAFLTMQRLNMAALAIAQIATYQAATTSDTNANINTNILNQAETQRAASAIYAYLPDTVTAATTSFAVVVTSISMTLQNQACTASCAYIANVAWSGQFQGTAGALRKCGANALAWVADRDGASSATLPTDLQQPQPLLAVDVYYTFRPLFFRYFTGDLLMMRSAYFSPRTGLPSDWVQYYPAGSSDQTSGCGGYPWSAVSP